MSTTAKMAYFWVPKWVKNGSFWGPKWVKKGSKMVQKGVKNGPFLDPFFDPFFQVPPKTCGRIKGFWAGPVKKGSKKGSKNGPKMVQKGSKMDHFWSILGSKMGQNI